MASSHTTPALMINQSSGVWHVFFWWWFFFFPLSAFGDFPCREETGRWRLQPLRKRKAMEKQRIRHKTTHIGSACGDDERKGGGRVESAILGQNLSAVREKINILGVTLGERRGAEVREDDRGLRHGRMKTRVSGHFHILLQRRRGEKGRREGGKRRR